MMLITRIKNSGRPQDFRFSNCHCPTQDLIAIVLLNTAVLLKSFPMNYIKGVSFLSTIIFSFGTVLKDNQCLKWFSNGDTPLSMRLDVMSECHFSYNQ